MEFVAVAEVGTDVFRAHIRFGQQHFAGKVRVDARAEVLQHGMRFRQVLAGGAFALDEVRHRIDAKSVDAEFQPELHHVPDFVSNGGIVVIEVWLMAEEPMPVVRLRDRVPGPVRELGVDEDDPHAPIPIVGFAPDVPVTTGVVPRAARFLEPGVLIGCVIQDELDDDAQPERMRLREEVTEVLQRAVTGMDARVIGDVVPVVLERRRVHRLEPETIHSERRDVIQLRREPSEIADAVAVAVGERLDVKLIEDGVLVPERIGGSQDAHVSHQSKRLPRKSKLMSDLSP